MRSREGDPDNHGEGLGVGGLLGDDLPRHVVHVHGGDDLILMENEFVTKVQFQIKTCL